MICVLCKERDVRPPECCDKCGRMVCVDCRKEEILVFGARSTPKSIGGSSLVRKRVVECKFCQAERELST